MKDIHEKEFCMRRISALQTFKEKLNKKINPLLADETMNLYVELSNQINELITKEAKYLTGL